MHSYFQDYVKEGKVRDLHQNTHEHFDLSTKKSAKAQTFRATSMPSSHFGTPMLEGDSLLLGWTMGSTQFPCLHNSKQHLL